MMYNQELTCETSNHGARFSCVKTRSREKKKNPEYEKTQELAFLNISII